MAQISVVVNFFK